MAKLGSVSNPTGSIPLNRNMRVGLLAALGLVMALAFTPIANVTGSAVWLAFWLTGIVTDVSSGPVWASWLLYAPAVILYGAVLCFGVWWVRSAPGPAKDK